MTRKLPLIAALAVLCLLTGCNHSPRQTWAVAADSYSTTLEILTSYRELGLIDAETAAEIEEYRVVARLALDIWHEALITGGDTTAAADAFHAALVRLVSIQSNVGE